MPVPNCVGFAYFEASVLNYCACRAAIPPDTRTPYPLASGARTASVSAMSCAPRCLPDAWGSGPYQAAARSPHGVDRGRSGSLRPGGLAGAPEDLGDRVGEDDPRRSPKNALPTMLGPLRARQASRTLASRVASLESMRDRYRVFWKPHIVECKSSRCPTKNGSVTTIRKLAWRSR